METLHIFSAATVDYIWIIKLICLGMKKYKTQNYTYVYHIMLDASDLSFYQKQFKDLQSDTFKIELLTSNIIFPKLGQERMKDRMRMSYAKCLIHYILPQLDKCLYLDTDLLIVNPGLEDLFNIDLGDHYLAAGYDIPIQLLENIYKVHREKNNCGVNNYFNTGVIYLNLKKIKQDGLDKILQHDLLEWPKGVMNYINEQTLFNYRVKQNCIFLHPKFNNLKPGCVVQNIPAYDMIKEQIGWDGSMQNSIIYHFTNLKPWNEVPPIAEQRLPFRKEAQLNLFKQIQILLNN